jgi:hypothetical protein
VPWRVGGRASFRWAEHVSRRLAGRFCRTAKQNIDVHLGSCSATITGLAGAVSDRSARHKSLFASFSSEKENLFFFEKKNQKTFISGAALPEDVWVWRKFRSD